MSSQDENQMPTPGSICWTDIPVQSLSRAQTFYGDAFGWTFRNPMDKKENCPEENKDQAQTKDMSDHPPMVMFASGPTHGGLTLVRDPANHVTPLTAQGGDAKQRMGVTVYIAVDEVNAGIEKVKKAGGEVIMPREVLPNNSGVIALVSDTEKNVLGLWSMK